MDYFSKAMMMKRLYKTKTWSRLLCFFMFLTMTACHGVSKKIPGKRQVTDMGGRTMLVPDTIRRVYMNRPGSLLLYAIDPRLAVCRTLWLSKAALPFLDSTFVALPYIDGSAEEIVKLKPDIIINCFSISAKTKSDADNLAQQTGIPVFQVEIDMTAYRKTFDLLGNLLHRETQTNLMDSFVHKYLDTIAARAALIPDEEKKRVYYAEGDCGLQTDPTGSFHSKILDFTGTKNVAEVSVLPGKGMSSVSMEQILLWDPEVVLCWTGMGSSTYRCMISDEVWQSLRALRNGSIYQIPYVPYGWFDRPPGTNRIIGTIWTANLIYPEIFPFNMKEVMREYFRVFYHHVLTDGQLQDMLFPDPDKMPGFIKEEGMFIKHNLR
jgi:iron complex transport system substrate-binding protein